MKNILLILGLILTCMVVNAKELTIKKLAANQSIYIDGEDYEWPEDITEQAMDQHRGEMMYKNNTATFKIAYDDNFLYVATKVLDATLDTSQSANAWEKDNITLNVIINDTVANGKAYSSPQFGGWYLRKIYGRDMTDCINKGFDVQEMDIAGGFMQEWKLPWDSLASTGIWNGKKFRFECFNDDNDGDGRRSQLFWNSPADDQWCTIQNQGYIMLESPLERFSARYLVVSSSSLNLNYSSGSNNISIHCDSVWSVQVDQAWLTFDKSSGTGDSGLQINFTENSTEASRTANITISSGTLTKTIQVTQAKGTKSITISKCQTAPVIDGNGNDPAWANAVSNGLYQTSGEANAAEFKMTYDNKFLYILVTVNDATPNQLSESYYSSNSDAVDLYFTMDTSITYFYSYSSNSFYRKICALTKENGGVRTKNHDIIHFPNAGFDIAQTDGTPYVQEWKIPFDSLILDISNDGNLKFNGKNFRFEMKVSDNNGQNFYSTGQTFWNNIQYEGHYTNDQYGYVTLAEPISPSAKLIVYDTYKSTGYYSGSYYVYLYTDTSWTAQSDQSWLSIGNSSGNGDSQLWYIISNNKSNIARSANITITAGNVTKKVKVYQYGVPCDMYADSLKNVLAQANDSLALLLAMSGRGETINKTIIDTINITKYDTIFVQHIDTITINRYDTVLVNKYDTVINTRYDTVHVPLLKMDNYSAFINLSGANVQFKLYPNPAKGIIQVECELPMSQIEILNLEGKQLFSKLINENNSYFDLEGFKEGTYILKVHTDKGVVGGKFVIKK